MKVSLSMMALAMVTSLGAAQSSFATDAIDLVSATDIAGGAHPPGPAPRPAPAPAPRPQPQPVRPQPQPVRPQPQPVRPQPQPVRPQPQPVRPQPGPRPVGPEPVRPQPGPGPRPVDPFRPQPGPGGGFRPDPRPPIHVYDPFPIHRGVVSWDHWDHPIFVRPIYGWEWNTVEAVTCTAESSYGYEYPVTENDFFGIQYESELASIEDEALDRCYSESGGDTGCYLVGCSPTYQIVP